MSLGRIRRISVVLMAMVVAIGVATHGLGGPDIMVKSAMVRAPDMAMPGDMLMSSDAPMPGKCSGCAGHEKGVAPAACATFCAAAIAIPSAAVVLYTVPAETLRPTTELIASGHSEPPDPYPPRPIVLS